MTASKTIYRDVSNNIVATMKAQPDPAARTALLNAGFTPIGLIEADASRIVTAQVREHVRRQPNGEEMLALLKHIRQLGPANSDHLLHIIIPCLKQ